ncbi:MAG TPA: hypothetical protein VGQ39_16495, partial [Pyrinomonadaceae bacterium]|nr:hypothetical protein [Pyrinomonadaceae bacterium]
PANLSLPLSPKLGFFFQTAQPLSGGFSSTPDFVAARRLARQQSLIRFRRGQDVSVHIPKASQLIYNVTSTPHLSNSQPHFEQQAPPHAACLSELGFLILGASCPQRGHLTVSKFMPQRPLRLTVSRIIRRSINAGKPITTRKTITRGFRFIENITKRRTLRFSGSPTQPH